VKKVGLAREYQGGAESNHHMQMRRIDDLKKEE
jgi:hypothetical protein